MRVFFAAPVECMFVYQFAMSYSIRFKLRLLFSFYSGCNFDWNFVFYKKHLFSLLKQISHLYLTWVISRCFYFSLVAWIIYFTVHSGFNCFPCICFDDTNISLWLILGKNKLRYNAVFSLINFHLDLIYDNKIMLSQ